MFEKIRISLWDVLVTFLSGFIFSLFAITHLFNFGLLSGLQNSYEIVSNITVLTFIGIPTIFVLGLVIDGLAIQIEDVVNWVKKKILINTKDGKNKYKEIEQFIQKKYIPNEIPHEIKPYFWCSYYLEENQIPSPYMAFLSKYGFYRTLSLIFIINAVLILLYNIDAVPKAALVIGSCLLSIVANNRSKKFLEHTAKSVYTGFLVAVNKKE